MPYIIIIVILSLISFIIAIVVVKKREIEQEKYYNAAYLMVKENYLNNVLKKEKVEDSNSLIQMLYIKLCNSKPKQGYVFNPEKEILFGRDKHSNALCVNHQTVSMNHCRIINYNNQLYVQDMNSTNGTVVQKGLKKYVLTSGQSITLETKNKIYIGDSIFQIIVFNFDLSQK